MKARKAHLRAGPSVRSELVWVVGKYMPLFPIDQKGSWIRVKDMDGQKMWISSTLVTNEIDCAVVKVFRSSLRRGPGTKFSKTPLNYANRYMPFRKLERDGTWILVKDDYGFKHWIHENNVWEALNYVRLNY